MARQISDTVDLYSAVRYTVAARKDRRLSAAGASPWITLTSELAYGELASQEIIIVVPVTTGRAIRNPKTSVYAQRGSKRRRGGFSWRGVAERSTSVETPTAPVHDLFVLYRISTHWSDESAAYIVCRVGVLHSFQKTTDTRRPTVDLWFASCCCLPIVRSGRLNSTQ